MTDREWERVAGLFERAVALPAAERARFLEHACGDDARLLASVHKLLQADADAPGLLDASPEQVVEAVSATNLPAAEGWRVGPYRLRRELGRGGMGVVYLAEREDLHNTVALKLLQRGPAAAMHGEWFRREQAVHAQLEHPNIARLLDAGVADDGTPWLVMEYVEGSAIDRHCDERRLTVPGRLALFIRVAEALAYAHRNLVVHRDVKPSNILVTPAGEPKLVDFGIAKLLSAEALPGQLVHTAGGVLTLAYASPEQLKGGSITTATDVYQLGLLLHELLTGLPACDQNGRPLDPMARMVDHEPARPSFTAELTPAGRDGTSGWASPSVRSALRQASPERLRRVLEGDLDTIVLKAIRPDPSDRYASAQQLVDDVRRYQDGQPVLARPGSLRYRLGKLIRRHRVTSALLATLVLVGLGAAITLGMQAAQVARERDRADQFSHLLEGLIYGADPLGIGDPQTARTVLDRTARQARAGISIEPAVWGRLLVVVGKTYQNMGHLTEAIAAQRDALAALRGAGGDDALVIDATRSLGTSLFRNGQVGEGRAALDDAVARARRGGPALRPQLGTSLGDLGGAVDDLDSAAALYREALSVLATTPDSGGADYDRLRVELGNVLLQGSHLAEAEALLRGAVDRLSAREGAASGSALHAKNELADILLKRGKLSPALAMANEVLELRRRLGQGPHDHLAKALLQQGRALGEVGRMAEAERSMRDAVSMWRELNGEESFTVAYAQVQLADILKRSGKVSEALGLEQDALGKYLRLSGPQSSGAVYTTTRLAHSEHLAGRWASSEARFRGVLPMLDSTPAGQGRLVRPLTDFSDLLAARGKCREAEPYLHQAMRIADQGWGRAHPVALRPRRILGRCLTERKAFVEAEEVLRAVYREAGEAGEYAPRERTAAGTELDRLYAAWGRGSWKPVGETAHEP